MKQTVIYKQGDGFAIKADFYPARLSNAPVLVYIHGGGMLWGSRQDIQAEMVQFYLDHGFSLFSIDYRLAPVSKLSDILADVQDALVWLEEEGPRKFSMDPRRIAVVGSSAGGFLALCAGTFKHKPKAIVSFYGYGDISARWAIHPNAFYSQKYLVPRELAMSLVSDQVITEAAVEKRYLVYLYARQSGEWVEEVTGIDPIIDKPALVKYCPIFNIASDYPPTLMLHGTRDTDVPYEQSVAMQGALRKEGIEASLITIPDGEHVFEKNFHAPVVQQALQQMVEFLQRHLPPAPGRPG